MNENSDDLLDRLWQVAFLLHPDRVVARCVLANAINKYNGTDIPVREVHRDQARVSARTKAGTPLNRETPSNLRRYCAMDREWLLHLLVLEESENRIKASASKDGYLSPCGILGGNTAVARFFAVLVKRSMRYQDYASVCIGKWVYGCDRLGKFLDLGGLGKNQYDDIRRTTKREIEALFSSCPKLVDISNDTQACDDLESLLACISPRSAATHDDARTKLARLAAEGRDYDRASILLGRIIGTPQFSWFDGKNRVSVVLAGPEDYAPSSGRNGVRPEYLRTEVLVDPTCGAFRSGLGNSYKPNFPRVPVWKMKSKDDHRPPNASATHEFNFVVPPEIPKKLRQEIKQELAQQSERIRNYKHATGARLEFELDGSELTLEKHAEGDVQPDVMRSALIPAGASQLCVYGQDNGGRVLLGTVFLSDLQALEPGKGLALAVGALNGPALHFFATDEPSPDDHSRFRLHADYVANSIAEPIILSECRIRAYVDDAVFPWFDLANPNYPYLWLRLQFDRSQSVVRLLSPRHTLPDIRCTRVGLPLVKGSGTENELRYVVASRDVPDLAKALGLPASFQRWGDNTDSPTGKGLLARLRESAGQAAAGLGLLQSKVLGALIARKRAESDDPWTALRELQGLLPAAATRAYPGPRGLASPWPSVLVALAPTETPDALTFIVVWTDPPKELPKVEAFLDKASLATALEYRGDTYFVHLPEPIPGLGDESSFPDWQLTWNWTPDVLTLRLSRVGVSTGE